MVENGEKLVKNKQFFRIWPVPALNHLESDQLFSTTTQPYSTKLQLTARTIWWLPPQRKSGLFIMCITTNNPSNLLRPNWGFLWLLHTMRCMKWMRQAILIIMGPSLDTPTYFCHEPGHISSVVSWKGNPVWLLESSMFSKFKPLLTPLHNS